MLLGHTHCQVKLASDEASNSAFLWMYTKLENGNDKKPRQNVPAFVPFYPIGYAKARTLGVIADGRVGYAEIR